MDIADNERMAVPLSIERGQPRIVTSSYFIQEVSKAELAMPKRLYTFDNPKLTGKVPTINLKSTTGSEAPCPVEWIVG